MIGNFTPSATRLNSRRCAKTEPHAKPIGALHESLSHRHQNLGKFSEIQRKTLREPFISASSAQKHLTGYHNFSLPLNRSNHFQIRHHALGMVMGCLRSSNIPGDRNICSRELRPVRIPKSILFFLLQLFLATSLFPFCSTLLLALLHLRNFLQIETVTRHRKPHKGRP